MKKLLLLVVILNLFQHITVSAQNLVPNYSFEIDTACGDYTKIYFARPWFQPSVYLGNTSNSSSSDLFGTCSPDWLAGIPVNVRGFQYSRTGVAYAGIYTHADTINTREYLEVPLTESLVGGRIYCVQYYVSLANTVGTAISNMGAYFSSDSLLASTYHAINYVTPQVENPFSNMLSDTLNWMLISGSFTAMGGEKFMTIGNFHNPLNTNFQLVNSGASVSPKRSYYFIDDVSVIDCTEVGVEEIQKPNTNFKLYPNPSNGITTLEYNIHENEVASLSIYDITGRLIVTYPINSQNSILNIDESELTAGIYYYNIRVNEKLFQTEKLIIIK